LPSARFIQKDSAIVSSIPDILSIYSKPSEKVDNIMPESLDNFLRNQWTTSIGIGGQLAPEYAHLFIVKVNQPFQCIRNRFWDVIYIHRYTIIEVSDG
jgi:hypothetical protein